MPSPKQLSRQHEPLDLQRRRVRHVFWTAWRIPQSHLFITGRAGTGKSTLLQHFRGETTKKKVVVLAPTGVAAVNVGGQTIHSFFGFRPGITLNNVRARRNGQNSIYKQLDMVIIDEISMVRADLFDCIEKFLRLNGPFQGTKFGGVQMVFIGDLYQLPPVVPDDEQELFETVYDSPFFLRCAVLPQGQRAAGGTHRSLPPT